MDQQNLNLYESDKFYKDIINNHVILVWFYSSTSTSNCTAGGYVCLSHSFLNLIIKPLTWLEEGRQKIKIKMMAMFIQSFLLKSGYSKQIDKLITEKIKYHAKGDKLMINWLHNYLIIKVKYCQLDR